jgi:hypothetical protein
MDNRHIREMERMIGDIERETLDARAGRQDDRAAGLRRGNEEARLLLKKTAREEKPK